jgi:hypothetical protein
LVVGVRCERPAVYVLHSRVSPLLWRALYNLRILPACQLFSHHVCAQVPPSQSCVVDMPRSCAVIFKIGAAVSCSRRRSAHLVLAPCFALQAFHTCNAARPARAASPACQRGGLFPDCLRMNGCVVLSTPRVMFAWLFLVGCQVWWWAQGRCCMA